MARRHAARRQVHLHPRHIPIGGSAYWDYDRLLLDYIPGPEGTEGQIIARNDIDFDYVCARFGELLVRTAMGFEAGRIIVSEATDDWELIYLDKPDGETIAAVDFFTEAL